MDIFLPSPREEDSLLKKTGIYLFSWAMWIVPAANDSVANDVGDVYQGGVMFITVFAVVLMLMVIYVGSLLQLMWWQTAGCTFGIYLFFGLLYHWYDSRW